MALRPRRVGRICLLVDSTGGYSDRPWLRRIISVEVERSLRGLLLGLQELAAPLFVHVEDAGHHVLLDHLSLGGHARYRHQGVTIIGVVVWLPPPAGGK